MAGIGFVLKKLAGRDDYLGVSRAFIHAAIVSSGPWLLTVAALGIIFFFSEKIIGFEDLLVFRTALVYNFSFSLVLSGPIYMVTTRYVADEIFQKAVTRLPATFLVSLLVVSTLALIIGCLLYFVVADINTFLAINAIINLILLSGLWQVMLFLSAIKNFRAITFSFITGIAISTICTITLAFPLGAQGLFIGFSAGFIFVLFSLFAAILGEYPYRYNFSFAYFSSFKRNKALAATGLFYNAGIWVDKWVMWYGHDVQVSMIGLPTAPLYDTAMFVAFLTVIPSFALFIFSVETNFFETYLTYFRQLNLDSPYALVAEKAHELKQKILDNGRNFLILQGSISLIIILLAPAFFKTIGMNFLQLNIFRLGAIGAFFNAMVLFIIIFLAYFDSKESILQISIFMFTTNLIFSLISRDLGFLFYGYGYFFSMAVTFLFASWLLLRYISNLNYHMFVTNNVKRFPVN